MPELERQLTALGATIAYPPTPDLVSKVRPRLAEREAPARSYRRPLALALAVVVLALAVAFAVPPARTALLLKKLVPDQTFVEPLQVGLGTGLWIQGGRHVLIWLDRTGSFREKPARVSGNILLWTHDALTLRLQGQLSKRDALSIAKDLR